MTDAPCPLCHDLEMLVTCFYCRGTGRVPQHVADRCIHYDCKAPPFKNGPLCIEHGCHRCGGVILADTEEWVLPVCCDCWSELGEPIVEPIWG